MLPPRQLSLLQRDLWPRARQGVVTLAALTLLTLTAVGSPGWADGPHGAHDPFNVPLRCQVNGGVWRECQMVVERVGSLWQLVLGSERFGFEHDGRGQVRMRSGEGEWKPVQARWTADAALCWDGLCAQGDLPLD